MRPSASMESSRIDVKPHCVASLRMEDQPFTVVTSCCLKFLHREIRPRILLYIECTYEGYSIDRNASNSWLLVSANKRGHAVRFWAVSSSIRSRKWSELRTKK